ncbi:DNA primase [Pseudooceanicola sp. 502str34]
MSLPPGFLDELRTRLSLSQVVGRKVMWDQRKSNQAKGDWWAPCPFHHEKSASFHVDDQKGFYYCFGCHAKGDAISFVRETENTGFMEAVEILAREAGLQMPERDPQAQKKADKRSQLVEVMEAAVQYYRMQLSTGAATEARAYLERRGLRGEALQRHEIGFAPNARQGAFQHLTAKGISPDLIVEAGICAKPDEPGRNAAPYDRFRDRIMFPIRDARGRCIAFGGRAMDPNARAKYLNSPETPLFDKSRSLYNHGPARAAAGKGQPVIVAEGYMDVIALVEAGFGGAVAPLGTAVTEHQLQMLWQMSSEPVVALDGDAAGFRAAFRVIDLALPLLEAGRALRFALMPEGKDPDDLIKAEGAEAMQKVLEGALPMVNLLWQREVEGKTFDSPERRAALDKTLRLKLQQIKDTSLRRHYGDAIFDLRQDLFKRRRDGHGRGEGGFGGGFNGGGFNGGGFNGGGGFSGKRGSRKPWSPGGRNVALPPTASTKASPLAMDDDSVQERLREAVILAALILTPELVLEFDMQVERMSCSDPHHAALRRLILTHAGNGSEALQEAIAYEMGAHAVDSFLSNPHVALTPPVRRRGDVEIARMTVAEELAKLSAQHGLRGEIEEALEEFDGPADETLTYRLGEAAQAQNRAARSMQEDKAEYDLGANGARINREERSALDALMETIRFTKTRK